MVRQRLPNARKTVVPMGGCAISEQPAMKCEPASPFTATHEEILSALSHDGVVYRCADPAEKWAPYVGEMLNAGLLAVTHDGLGSFDFTITDAGRQRLEVLRLGAVD